MLNINSIINSINDSIKDEVPKDKYLSFVSDNLDNIYLNLSKTNNEYHSKLAALKISNLLTLKYEYVYRESSVFSKPFALSAEPSNACNLFCSGCIRESKPNNIKKGIVWDKAFMDISKYSKLLKYFGPFAMIMQLHNWGEPTLNKQLSQMVKLAKEYFLYVFFSTNLSAKIDAEALVLSGVDFITVAIDGASPETYSKYRQGGIFDLAIKNLENLSHAKKKYNKHTPVITWQFLTFEHNFHELDSVITLAEELGVNRVHIGTPYPFSDNPELTPYKSRRNGPVPINMQMKFIREEMNENIKSTISPEEIDSTYFSTIDTYLKNTCVEIEQHKYQKTCKWLYMNMFMDAHGRILPCCFPPHPNAIFGEITDLYSSSFNSSRYTSARKWFSGGSEKSDDKEKIDFACLNCPNPNSNPNMNLAIVKRLLHDYDVYAPLSDKSIDILTDWDTI